MGQAETAAHAAAARAGVQILDVEELAALQAVCDLFDGIWRRAQPMVGRDLLRALTHAGNQVSAAYERPGDAAAPEGPPLTDVVGATVAFLGRQRDGRVHLHSHITGTSLQGRGVGFALKQHQRWWALRRGIDEVRWTFDPLVRRNAFFNLVKLGARAADYVQDLYGRVDDAINAGVPTDRAVAAWKLTGGRVVACSEGRFHEPDLAALQQAGAVVALDEDADGAPRISPVSGKRVLVRVPVDIEGMRRRRPELAHRWQDAVRETLGAALDAGFRTSGFTRAGFYVLTRGGDVEELAG